jgi:hypothetical protein
LPVLLAMDPAREFWTSTIWDKLRIVVRLAEFRDMTYWEIREDRERRRLYG